MGNCGEGGRNSSVPAATAGMRPRFPTADDIAEGVKHMLMTARGTERWVSCMAFLMFISVVVHPTPAPARSRDDWQQPQRVIRDLNVEPGDRIADVGCGEGYFTFRVARQVGQEGQVLATDINKSAVDSVREKAKKEELSRVKAVHSRPADAMLPAQALDGVLLCLVLHHADEDAWKGLMDSIVKGLQPGGYLFVLDFRKVRDPLFHSYEQLVSRETAVELARDAGLELDAEFYYLEHQYFLRFRKPTD
mgnify:CR=1 FL=1